MTESGDQESIKMKIRTEPINWDIDEFDEVSAEGKNFLRKCLIKDPKQRWSSNQMLNHPWLKDVLLSKQKINENSMIGAINSINNYMKTNHIQKSIISILAQ